MSYKKLQETQVTGGKMLDGMPRMRLCYRHLNKPTYLFTHNIKKFSIGTVLSIQNVIVHFFSVGLRVSLLLRLSVCHYHQQ